MNAVSNAVIQALSDDQMKASDFIILVDHSGSMDDKSLRFPGRTRYQELQEDATALARQAERFDSDGLTVIAFSSSVRVFDGVTADTVANTFKEVSPRGSTNLADALRAAIQKVEQSQKNGIILAFTDGIPDSTAEVYNVINEAGKKLGRPKLGITFVQVGEDPSAKAFLEQLNNNLTVDVVAVASAKDAEGLSLQQLAWMAQNA